MINFLCAALAMLAWLLLAAPANAQCSTPAPGGNPNGNGCSGVASLPAGGANSGAGNPINVMTGNKYQREDDLPALPGVLGLEIVRHYNSAYSAPGHPNGVLGRGWRLSYETELVDRFGKLQVLQADGGRVIFDRDRDSPTGCSTKNPENGSMTLGRQNGRPDYTWTWTDGRKLHFNYAGKLDRITAPSGEVVRLLYDDQNVLVRVIDPQGRSLNLVYYDRHARNQFHGVQFIDTPVGRFAYEYGSAMPKGAGLLDQRQLLSNLVRVRLPDHFDPDTKAHALSSRGTTRSTTSRIYHHEDSRSPWLMTGISLETAAADGKPVSTRYATYGYDGTGRAILSTHAGNVDKVTLDISKAGETVLTNSLGQKTVYRYAVIAGEYRLLEVRGAGCALCDEANVRYGYDSVGRLADVTRLAENGEPLATTRTVRDKLGRVNRISKIAYQNGRPGPEQAQVRFEYRSDGFAPALIARPSVVLGKELITRIDYNDIGQPLSVSEIGWSPAADGPQVPTQIVRTIRYRYVVIDGRSLLAEIDGPLPNGKTGTPFDSDITLIEYDHRRASLPPPKAPSNGAQLLRYESSRGHAGIVTAIIMPGNRESDITYDYAGRVASVKQAKERNTSLRYSPRGDLLAITQGGITYTTHYDGLGHPVESGHGDGANYRAFARLGYDDAGRNTWAASALGIVTTWRFDTEGQLLERSTLSNTIKQTQHYDYDQSGHLRAVTDATGGTRRIGWNALGLPDALTDTLGRTMRFGYDAAGDITAVADAVNAVTRFELDVYGRPTAVVTPNGAATRYLRDDFGRIVATIGADSGKTTRRFDAADRLVASFDANGNRASYEYDVMGRIVSQSVTDAGNGGKTAVTTWRYDGTHLVAIEHPDQSERYGYDGQGRVTTRTVILGLASGAHVGYTTRYRYDAMGQLAGASLPDGSTLNYRRNGQNQITSLERDPGDNSWLRWLLPRQTIVQNLERDVVGLKRLTYGNGIEADYQRSKEGSLARIAYRDPRLPAAREQHGGALAALLGVRPALAASATTQALPGALELPPDTKALLDHRYMWDTQGNLLFTRDKDTARGYAYDARDRLIVAASGPQASFSRYHYDDNGNRLLAQEGVDQSDLRGNTVKTGYAPDADRWQTESSGDGTAEARYDATGLPERIGKRSFVWDALGKLLEVRDGQRVLARYRYDHRGERIEKIVGGEHTYYLYEDRKLVAELDGQGTIRRQYVYLAEQPVAIIDTTNGGSANGTTNAGVKAGIANLWRAWFGKGETIVYLQTNHLGAVEMATDVKGKPIWQANYGPFGKLMPAVARRRPGFELNLRLPGQYADKETGLYYNDHRYYDPARGRYLTPDPLGLGGGANGYAYVGGNPLKYIDPEGLVLFAFDGTGNGEAPPAGDSISNVRKFYEAYNKDVNGPKYYITGIGTTNKDMSYAGSIYSGDGFDQRVALGFKFLNDLINAPGTPPGTVDIDVVGFSRGAAEARVWMNQLVDKLVGGRYSTSAGRSRCINLRFEGLWDTVSHLGKLFSDDKKYNFGIPLQVKYVVQAVALNEHRGDATNFDGRSIFDAASIQNTANRIELGFVGSHADIGGGYGTGDLSDATLMWIIQQAKSQGIRFTDRTITDAGWNKITSPILHDKSRNNQYRPGDPPAYDRQFIYGNGKSVNQAAAVIGGNNWAWTRNFVSYYPKTCGTSGNAAVGQVDMTKYSTWLATQGVTMGYVKLSPTPLCN
jgi:RHS repeat-associated protein